MKRNGSDPALWLMVGSLLAVGVLVTLHVRRARGAVTQMQSKAVETPDFVPMEQIKTAYPPNAQRVELVKGQHYLVNISFPDSSALPDVESYLRSVGTSWEVVGSSSISLTARVAAARTMFQKVPKTVTTSAGKQYTVAGIRKA